jgi:hypothetical protein
MRLPNRAVWASATETALPILRGISRRANCCYPSLSLDGIGGASPGERRNEDLPFPVTRSGVPYTNCYLRTTLLEVMHVSG